MYFLFSFYLFLISFQNFITPFFIRSVISSFWSLKTRYMCFGDALCTLILLWSCFLAALLACVLASLVALLAARSAFTLTISWSHFSRRAMCASLFKTLDSWKVSPIKLNKQGFSVSLQLLWMEFQVFSWFKNLLEGLTEFRKLFLQLITRPFKLSPKLFCAGLEHLVCPMGATDQHFSQFGLALQRRHRAENMFWAHFWG